MRRPLDAVFPRRALLSGLHGIAAGRTTRPTEVAITPHVAAGSARPLRSHQLAASEPEDGDANSASNSLAAFRTGVLNPSVNLP